MIIDHTAEPTTSTFVFPRLFIAASAATTGCEQPRVYELSVAPPWIFNAWVNRILDAEEGLADPVFLWTVKEHRDSWDLVARWWLINALALMGVDLSKYYVESAEEAQ